ncbi:hypothetical protein DXT77_18745 [Pseudomonas sp. 91RF]|nr:hypothetical protein DXT77_18745 [Pseudomonas sp. 91RF]
MPSVKRGRLYGDWGRGVQFEIGGVCQAAFASRLAPTVDRCRTQKQCGSEPARERAGSDAEDLQSSFFIRPASAANGLCVALAIFGVLREPSPKYCWSV